MSGLVTGLHVAEIHRHVIRPLLFDVFSSVQKYCSKVAITHRQAGKQHTTKQPRPAWLIYLSATVSVLLMHNNNDYNTKHQQREAHVSEAHMRRIFEVTTTTTIPTTSTTATTTYNTKHQVPASSTSCPSSSTSSARPHRRRWPTSGGRRPASSSPT